MRVIKLINNIVVETKHVLSGYVLQDGEIQSETGEIGQVRQPDGTFITPEPELVEPEPALDEIAAQTSLNTEYLVILSEISSL